MPIASPLEDPRIALGDQHAELAGLLAGLTRADWERPTRCTGWTVADVVLHLSQSDELAIASLNRRFDDALSEAGAAGVSGTVDEWAEASVAAQRGPDASEVHQRWRQSASDVRRQLADADLSLRVAWVAGDLSVATLATTRLAEAWIHAGDVADAVGVPLRPAERLRHVARLAWRTLPYAFARAGRRMTGPVTFELQGPEGDRWQLVPDDPAVTLVRGDGVELCRVAARRLEPGATAVVAEGPDADAVLELVRTYA